jgi:hypothetical protein
LKKRTRNENRKTQAKMAISVIARGDRTTSQCTCATLTKNQTSTKARSDFAIQLRKEAAIDDATDNSKRSCVVFEIDRS